jgi:hypothetical protein
MADTKKGKLESHTSMEDTGVTRVTPMDQNIK